MPRNHRARIAKQHLRQRRLISLPTRAQRRINRTRAHMVVAIVHQLLNLRPQVAQLVLAHRHCCDAAHTRVVILDPCFDDVAQPLRTHRRCFHRHAAHLRVLIARKLLNHHHRLLTHRRRCHADIRRLHRQVRTLRIHHRHTHRLRLRHARPNHTLFTRLRKRLCNRLLCLLCFLLAHCCLPRSLARWQRLARPHRAARTHGTTTRNHQPHHRHAIHTGLQHDSPLQLHTGPLTSNAMHESAIHQQSRRFSQLATSYDRRTSHNHPNTHAPPPRPIACSSIKRRTAPISMHR